MTCEQLTPLVGAGFFVIGVAGVVLTIAFNIMKSKIYEMERTINYLYFKEGLRQK